MNIMDKDVKNNKNNIKSKKAIRYEIKVLSDYISLKITVIYLNIIMFVLGVYFLLTRQPIVIIYILFGMNLGFVIAKEYFSKKESEGLQLIPNKIVKKHKYKEGDYKAQIVINFLTIIFMMIWQVITFENEVEGFAKMLPLQIIISVILIRGILNLYFSREIKKYIELSKVHKKER